MILHLFYFGLLREIVEQVLHVKYLALILNDLEGRLYGYCGPTCFRIEQVLSNLHPKLALNLPITALVCVAFGQLEVLYFKCQTYSLLMEI